MVLFYIVIDFSPTSTTNAHLVRLETATPFVPYISALKGKVLRHCLIKESLWVI
ncbi:hypothetical protein INT80_07990 [Gallibacterium anatis]|uniref:Uncharacterized protein n=1 Tax=Gallibacterium anatis TaxID=750 RepID=A0A930URI3_9PAST|nr:hypothetical protein [Gallibacterium anatis]